MDIDPMDLASAEEESSASKDKSRLNAMVAVTIALLATFMGICKVKDDNIVQAMQQAQADKLDHWNFYQARNIRQEVAAATAAQLKLAEKSSNSTPPTIVSPPTPTTVEQETPAEGA